LKRGGKTAHLLKKEKKMNRKKLLIVSLIAGLIALIFCFAFTACGDKLEEDEEGNKTDDTKTDPTVPGGTAITSITISNKELSLNTGGTATLTVSINPSSAASSATVTWSSDKTGIAIVDGNGKVSAVAAGTATITVKVGEFTDTCTVTVTTLNVPVTGVSISPSSLILLKGEYANLTPLVQPTTATNKEVKWSSGNTSIAEISVLSGQVKANATGTATITVTTTDGNKTGTCAVTVVDIGLTAGAGKYSASYGSATTETVELSGGRFYLYDNAKSGAELEFIDFSITKWETATVPSAQSGTFTKGYKITGKITGANPKNTGASPNLYGSTTAPGFTQSDINNTECWMYVYISSTGGSFVRTQFNKAGTTEVTSIIGGRTYTPVVATP